MNVTSSDLSTATQGTAIVYGYGDNNWSDKLTSYDGQTISYDASGNPTSYRGETVTWNGRLMTSFTKDDRRYEYSYNSDGMRTVKRVYEDDELVYTYTYIWDGDVLLGGRMEVTDTDEPITIRYLYDDSGELYGMDYNGNGYFGFIKNLQGDIVSIIPLDSESNVEVNMEYDAWGKPIYVQGSSLAEGFMMAVLTAVTNVGYRGYFYDFETGLYYLRSRYYDPETGRFINADDTAYLGYNGSPLSMNLFAYCENNPVCNLDPNGYKFFDFLRDEQDGFLGFYNTGKTFKDFFTKPWATIKRPWQMKAGYNNLYDQGAKYFYMYIDWLISEFYCNGESWRIELWKGRYGISVGAEIGIYYRPKIYKNFKQWTCYDGFFHMSLVLGYIKTIKSKHYFKEVLYREDDHWWLTGFMASANLSIANPFGNRLAIIAEIDFPNSKMANLFVKNLNGIGYFITVVRRNSVLIIWTSKYYDEVIIE